jgi:hypothetical protein
MNKLEEMVRVDQEKKGGRNASASASASASAFSPFSVRPRKCPSKVFFLQNTNENVA